MEQTSPCPILLLLLSRAKLGSDNQFDKSIKFDSAEIRTHDIQHRKPVSAFTDSAIPLARS